MFTRDFLLSLPEETEQHIVGIMRDPVFIHVIGMQIEATKKQLLSLNPIGEDPARFAWIYSQLRNTLGVWESLLHKLEGPKQVAELYVTENSH